METEENRNPLLSKSKNSDSRLQVQLHPLVILNVSDHITRHVLRQKTGPIVGAILGSQNGRDITMEHAFECKVEQGNSPGEVVVDPGWFHDRLQQYKDVHKAAALDFVGWFTLAPPSGPQPQHLPIHHQLLHMYNESALLLTFHPASFTDGTSKGGKLPLAIYETVYEAASDDNDKHMQSPGEAGPQLSLRFQELPYTVETGEAEMIGVNFVATGGANASATSQAAATSEAAQTAKSKVKGKGKATAASTQAETNANGAADGSATAIAGSGTLSAEDEERIASLTAKANAIKMLQQRINLIQAYLKSIPPCYLNTPPSTDPASAPPPMAPDPQISHPILRQISALLARLPLLTTSDSSSSSSTTNPTNGSTAQHPSASPHKLEQQTQQTDTQLITLLSTLGSTLQSASALGKKVSVYETTRSVNMSQSQRHMMSQMRGEQGQGPGQMPFGFDQQQGAFARGAGGGAYPSSASRLRTDAQFGDDGRMDEDDFDEEGDDGPGRLQDEDWEEMDENS